MANAPTVLHADGREYPQRRVSDDAFPRIVARIPAHGYGVPAAELTRILLKLTPEERANLLYVCGRTAEKLVPDVFRPE